MVKLLKRHSFRRRSISTMVLVASTMVFVPSTMVFVVLPVVFVISTMVFAVSTMVSGGEKMYSILGTVSQGRRTWSIQDTIFSAACEPAAIV